MEIKKFKVSDYKIKALIYGKSGVGKTTFASKAPNTIFASSEDGLLSIKDEDVSFVKIESKADLQELHKFLKTGDHEFETVVIDSITDVSSRIREDIEKRTGKQMSQREWGEVAKSVEGILRAFKELPMHVIFLAQHKSLMDEDVVTEIVPDLYGKTASKACYFMDIVGYMFIDKEGVRKIVVTPKNKLVVKDRSNELEDDTEPNFNVWLELINKGNSKKAKKKAAPKKKETETESRTASEVTKEEAEKKAEKKAEKPKDELQERMDEQDKEEEKEKKTEVKAKKDDTQDMLDDI